MSTRNENSNGSGEVTSVSASSIPTTKRRGFLVGAASTSAAGIAAVALSQKSVALAPTSTAAAPSSGYQVSEHVKRYYRTTTV
jgi:hypothetical protein